MLKETEMLIKILREAINEKSYKKKYNFSAYGGAYLLRYISRLQ